MKTDRKIKAGPGSGRLKAGNKVRVSASRSNGKHRGEQKQKQSRSRTKAANERPLNVEEVLQLQQQFSVIYKHAPIGIVESSPEGRYLRVNEEFCRISGYEKEELLRLGIQELTHEEDYSIDIILHQQLVTGKIPSYQIETRYVRKDGGIIWAELTRNVVRDADGKALYTIGVVLDVTERKRAELEMRNLSKMPAENPNPVMRLTPDGKVLYANNASAPLLEFWKSQIGQKLPDEWQKYVAETFASGLKKEIEIEYGGKTLAGTLTPIRGAAYVNFYGSDITERKRAEEALRESEALYRTIARSIPGGGVYVIDKDFRYIVADGPVTEAFGLSRETLEGHTVSEVFPTEAGKRMEERLRRNFAGETVDFETKYNGRVYWTQQAPLRDSIGHAIVVTIDITERKQMEEALRQSEERFARFMQYLPGLAWIKDVQGRYVYANAAAEKAFGTPRDKLYGKTDQDVFPPEAAAEFQKNDERALAEGKDVQIIETLEHDDGVLHYSLVNKFPIPGPDGNTALIGGTAFDITERKQAEEALRESEQWFRAIVNQATAGIVRKDVEGRLTFVNQAFCEMLGYSESELIGKTIWELTCNDDIEENKRLFDRMVAQGIPFKLEKRLIRRDGSILWVDVSVSPVLDAAGKLQFAVAVGVDITGRKQAEEALRQLNLQLESRVRARTAELQIANETLTEEIDERKRAEEALHESWESLQILSRRLVEVQEEERRAIARELHDRVGQTLAALNINLIIMSGQLSEDAMQRIGSRMNDSMQLTAEAIALVRNVMTDLRPAVLDDYGLEAALQSYIDEYNSRYEINVRFDRSDEPVPRLGASLEMTLLRIAQEALTNVARHAHADQASVSLQIDSDGAVHLEVQDNGMGIENSEKTDHPVSHGLKIMRERAEAFGGTVNIESVPGKGTKVEARIPIENRAQNEIQEERR